MICPNGEVIKIISAHFGRAGYVGDQTCQSDNSYDDFGYEMDCGYNDVYNLVANLCDERSHCSVTVNEHSLGQICQSSPCNQNSLYADVFYSCLDQTQIKCWHLTSRETSTSPQHWTASSLDSRPKLERSCSSPRQSYSPNFDKPKQGIERQLTHFTNKQPTRPPPSAFNARLGSSNYESWCPAFCDKRLPFIQIDMGAEFLVTGFFVQGQRFANNYVRAMAISFSHDGRTWYELKNPIKEASSHVFEASNDSRTISGWYLNNLSFIARYVRFVALDYVGNPCMHLELIRCKELIQCGPLFVDNSDTNGRTGQLEEIITINCLPNFETIDGKSSFEMLCESPNGGQGLPTWTGNRHCSKVKRCSNIPYVQNALHNATNMEIGTTIHFECMDGRMYGLSDVTCKPDGQWSPLPFCKAFLTSALKFYHSFSPLLPRL